MLKKLFQKFIKSKNDILKFDDIYWLAVDPIWEKVSIYDGFEKYKKQISKFPDIQINLFAAHWLNSEVNNGGFHQFYSNSTGIVIIEAIRAYKEMGLINTSNLIEKTARFFENHDIRDREVRNELLDEYEDNHDEDLWNPFENDDDNFYKMCDDASECFSKSASEYLLKNLGQLDKKLANKIENKIKELK